MSENNALNTTKPDINLSGTDFNKNNLDAFLQGAYSRTVAVSHNHSCTFHSMGRNILEMYLEDKESNVSNGLGERIIKKLLEKHGKKLKNPIWAHAGWHPLGSFAYRKTFWESVKYYFSNATWGWLNLFNPFFWLSELIWGEYKNDIFLHEKNGNSGKNDMELDIKKNLDEKEKYRIGNILGQLIREEIAVEVDKVKETDVMHHKQVTETEVEDDFINIEDSSEDKTTTEDTTENSIKPNTSLPIIRLSSPYATNIFNGLYCPQGSPNVVYEWQYLTSKYFLGEQADNQNQQNNKPLETIVLEIENKSMFISDENSYKKYNLNYPLEDDIKTKLQSMIDGETLPLICVMGPGFSMGRCQPIVGLENKKKFISDLLDTQKEKPLSTVQSFTKNENEIQNKANKPGNKDKDTEFISG